MLDALMSRLSRTQTVADPVLPSDTHEEEEARKQREYFLNNIDRFISVLVVIVKDPVSSKCKKHYQSLIDELSSLKNESKDVETTIGNLITKHINAPFEGLTPLQRLVVIKTDDKAGKALLHENIQVLLELGADPKATTREYARSTKEKLQGVFRHLSFTNPAIDSIALAKRQGSPEVVKILTAANQVKDEEISLSSSTNSMLSAGPQKPVEKKPVEDLTATDFASEFKKSPRRP